MKDNNDEIARPTGSNPEAASSSTSVPPAPADETEECIYRMLERLCPGEEIIRRSHAGKF